jgi:hypothetical protein
VEQWELANFKPEYQFVVRQYAIGKGHSVSVLWRGGEVDTVFGFEKEADAFSLPKRNGPSSGEAETVYHRVTLRGQCTQVMNQQASPVAFVPEAVAWFELASGLIRPAPNGAMEKAARGKARQRKRGAGFRADHPQRRRRPTASGADRNESPATALNPGSVALEFR